MDLSVVSRGIAWGTMMNCNGLSLILLNDFFSCMEFEMSVGSVKVDNVVL